MLVPQVSLSEQIFLHYPTNTSIHHAVSRSGKVVQTSLFPSNIFLLLLGDPEVVARPDDMYSFQHVLGLPQGQAVAHAWKPSSGSRPGGIPIGCSTHLNGILSLQSCSDFTPSSPEDIRASYPTSKSEPCYPAEKTRISYCRLFSMI